MLTRWAVSNFKSLREGPAVELRPLTVLVGANSSGKSTLLQSMLLVAQTLEDRFPGRPILLNGRLVRLGQFDDIRSSGSIENHIRIEWDWQTETTEELFSSRASPYFGENIRQLSVSCSVVFDVDPASKDHEYQQLHPRLLQSELTCSASSPEDGDTTTEITLRRVVQNDADLVAKKSRLQLVADEPSVAVQSLEYDVDLDDASLAEVRDEMVSGLPVGCVPRHFLPGYLVVRTRRSEEEGNGAASVLTFRLGPAARRFLRTKPEAPIPRELLTFLSTELGECIEPLLREDRTEQGRLFEHPTDSSICYRQWRERFRRLHPSRQREVRACIQKKPDLFAQIVALAAETGGLEYDLQPFGVPDELAGGLRALERFFATSFKYLGPLRDEPKPTYPLSTSLDPTDVGLRGENTAAVLDLHKRHMVSYLRPREDGEWLRARNVVEAPLEEALKDWLQYLGVAFNVRTQDKGKHGHSLKVLASREGRAHDLTHVGVGVSQVLPILVTCLLARIGTMLVFEQPELHLHPRVQTRLGDFFLSMALLRKQCVIETHSEYLINRLRLRIAQAPVEASLLKEVSLYSSEKRGDTSHFEPIVLTEHGSISDWPESFFDEYQREVEQILLVGTGKRRLLRAAPPQ